MDLIRFQLPNEDRIDVGIGSWESRVVNYKEGTYEFLISTEKYFESLGKIIDNFNVELTILVYRKIDSYDRDFETAVAMRSVYFKPEPDEIRKSDKIVSIRQQSNYTVVTIKEPKVTEDLPVGTISPYASLFPPKGHLECNGKSVAKEKYPDLFNVIGNSFGNTTKLGFFKLPDLRGTYMKHKSSGVSKILHPNGFNIIYVIKH